MLSKLNPKIKNLIPLALTLVVFLALAGLLYLEILGLNLITKEDIGTKISIEDYNKACRREVMKYKEVWDDLTRKMGYWVDLDHPYITFENDYIESVWSLLSKLYSRNLLYKGYTIPSNYDSMIAKIITTAQTREEAIAKMKRALEEFYIEGIKTTIPFHRQLMEHPDYLAGNYTTKFMEDFVMDKSYENII